MTKEGATPLGPGQRDVFTGHDRVAGVTSAVATGMIGLILAPVARSAHVPWWAITGAVLAASGLAAGCRYRLGIGEAGVELVALRAWIIPTRRRRWLLDADIELYESWDADAPEGVCVASRRDTTDQESECFGPRGETRIRALQASAAASLARCRSGVLPGPPHLRHRLLSPQAHALDVAHAVRSPAGRLKEITSLASIKLGALEIPAGSRFRFNDPDGFVDPRRDDSLSEVEIRDAVVIHGLVTRPGAVLRFTADGAGPVAYVRNAFDRLIEIEGFFVRGDEGIGFGTDGALGAFTLGRATRLAGFEIPAGSRLHFSRGWGKRLPSTWTCHLTGPLALPAVTLVAGESCQFSADRMRVVSVSPRHDLVIPGGCVRAGVLPIPVTPEGRIDLAACRKKSLVL